jgi:predicted ArsR family transcriptional regulator
MPRASRDERQRQQQRQARALGDPTRSAIFWHVVEAGRAVRVAELVQHFGLNHQGVRQHLAKLADAGLLVEEIAEPAGSGRPPLQYRIAPQAITTWVGPSPYAELSVLLLQVLDSGRSAREVAAEAGRSVEAPLEGLEPLDVIEAEMARRGFEPQRVHTSSTVDIVLQRCAFEVAADADRAVVCELHLGLAEGMTEVLGGGLEVTELVARDPAQAGCRLKLRNRDPRRGTE